MSEERKIPNHIAIILDGNGRWAKKHLQPRNFGHRKGSENVKKIVEHAANIGVKYISLYAFSTENWNRPESEIDALMGLLREYLKDSIKECTKNNVFVRVIGEKSRLDEDIQEKIIKLEEETANNDKLFLQIAINYGGRDEIKRAVEKIATEVKNGNLNSDDITEDTISDFLDTRGIPDPDLLIRTSGEERISNFLIWQMAYTEYYFSDKLWPEFSEKDFDAAIDEYNNRNRRFGKTQSQIEGDK